MRAEVRNAAAVVETRRRREGSDGPSLCDAVPVVRRFLEELRERSGGWKVLARYALGAVIALLDTFAEDCE